MTKDFRDQGLIMNEQLEIDGTTAVVRTEHLPAEEVEFMRWKADLDEVTGRRPGRR